MMKTKNAFLESEKNSKAEATRSSGRLPICMAIACIYSSSAHALPQDPSVVSGAVNITATGQVMEINQASNRAIINWQKFGIEPEELVKFNQPSSSSLVLNRVTGLNNSVINGALTANGKIFIINPNGVLFGENAQVNVGGVVASSMDITDANFLNSDFSFSRQGNAVGSVKNAGSITAVEGGYVVMLSDQVSNTGNIDAPGGSVLMGAGSQLALYFSKDSLVGYAITRETAAALVENAKNIRAAGGTVSLAAKGINNTTQSAVVNNTGIIEARTLRNAKGKIELAADMQSGHVLVSGKLDASAADGDGGNIDTSGAVVAVEQNAVITSSAARGKTGLWTIKTASVRISDNAGDIDRAALGRSLTSSNVTISAEGNEQQDSGDLAVNGEIIATGRNKLVLKAGKDVLINAPVTVNAGGIIVHAGMNGTGNGALKFADSGKILASPQGGIAVYTNVPDYRNTTLYDGFITSPYSLWMLVNDVNQLQKINENTSGKYALGRDIDASETAHWVDGFSPIGAGQNGFTGQLDGMNHFISNLRIHRPLGSKVGLFSQSKGVIRNLGLVNVDITGNDAVGAVAGDNHGIISNVYATGTVSIDVHPANSETAPNQAGGLVGINNEGGAIRNAYSLVTVRGKRAVGGIAGSNYGKIDGVYAAGQVGHVDDKKEYFGYGGIAGFNSGQISNAYWTLDGTGQSRAFGRNTDTIEGNTESGRLDNNSLKNAALNLDFDNTWIRYHGYTFPLLKSFLKPLDILSLDSNVEKIYDGKPVPLQAKLFYSDPTARFSTRLGSTPSPDINGAVDAGDFIYKNTRHFWSDQQGYYIKNPVLEQVVSLKVDTRPIVVEAVGDFKEHDSSVISNAKPALSNVFKDNNLGLADGDTMAAKQEFDSTDIGNRVLKVVTVEIRNRDGKDVTSNYRLAKADADGFIAGKPTMVEPGGGHGGNGNSQGGSSPGQGGSNQIGSAPRGSAPGGSASGGSTPIGAADGNFGEGGTGDAGIGGGSGAGSNGSIAGNSNPLGRYTNLNNPLAFLNIDEEDELKKRLLNTADKNNVSLRIVDDGMNLPARID